MLADEKGHAEIARLLLEAGADIESEDKCECTAEGHAEVNA